MPNWVSNDLYITGSEKERQRLKKFVAGDLVNWRVSYEKRGSNKVHSEFCFGKIIKPSFFYVDILGYNGLRFIENIIRFIAYKFYKDDLGERTDFLMRSRNPSGYEWAWRNWGTKWETTEVDVWVRGDNLMYYFDTAWECPRPVIYKLVKMFPKLHFELKYYEEGMGFAGSICGEDGKVYCDEVYTTEREFNANGFEFMVDGYDE